jgi:hypothetical protein
MTQSGYWAASSRGLPVSRPNPLRLRTGMSRTNSGPTRCCSRDRAETNPSHGDHSLAQAAHRPTTSENRKLAVLMRIALNLRRRRSCG